MIMLNAENPCFQGFKASSRAVSQALAEGRL
jgi:hypothetical protein